MAALPLCTALAQDAGPQGAAARAVSRRAEPGDRVLVRVAREPLLGDSVFVDARGEIVLPRLGIITAASLTIDALRDTLRARYGGFIRNPSVDVQVLRRVVVNGDVTKPNVYFADVNATVRDLIAMAGGITEQGDPDRVSIVRRGAFISVPNWQNDFTAASDLHSGDELFVGRRSWLSRNGLALASSSALVVSVLIGLFK